jgi:cytochrome d ubiquinol oxidase subunit I
MRVMAYSAVLVFLVALWGLWLIRRKKIASSRWFLRLAIWTAVLPFLMNTAGWLLTESGRQPWIVQGVQLTKNGVSPSVSALSVAISLAVFVALYGVLGVVDFVLMRRYARKEIPAAVAGGDADLPVPAVQY